MEESKKAKKTLKLSVRLLILIPVISILYLLAYSVIIHQIIRFTLLSKKEPISAALVLLTEDYMNIALSFVGLFAFATGCLLAYRITLPIQKVSKSLESVAAGDLTQKIETLQDNELGLLGQNFNLMVTSLNNMIKERDNTIFGSMSSGLIIIDNNGIINSINIAGVKILDLDSSKEATGQNIESIMPQSPVNEAFREIVSDGLQKGSVYSSLEVEVETQKNKKINLGLTTSRIFDSKNVFKGLILTFRDLTYLQKIQKNMNIMDRLAAVGSMASNLAHEIRNPLSAIKGMAQLLTEDLKSNNKELQYVQVITKESDRLNKVIEELLSYSQSSPSGYIECDVNKILRESLELIGVDFTKKTVDVFEDYQDLPLIYADKVKLSQAFGNVILNAFQATEENGAIYIKTELNRIEDRVIIEISNSGSSIPEENRERIFEPFFTTKKDGIGLGLSIVYNIISSHQGSIDVTSERELTSFIISLPINIRKSQISEF
jgi:PAS domain S-box-containing protein